MRKEFVMVEVIGEQCESFDESDDRGRALFAYSDNAVFSQQDGLARMPGCLCQALRAPENVKTAGCFHLPAYALHRVRLSREQGVAFGQKVAVCNIRPQDLGHVCLYQLVQFRPALVCVFGRWLGAGVAVRVLVARRQDARDTVGRDRAHTGTVLPKPPSAVITGRNWRAGGVYLALGAGTRFCVAGMVCPTQQTASLVNVEVLPRVCVCSPRGDRERLAHKCPYGMVPRVALGGKVSEFSMRTSHKPVCVCAYMVVYC